jgi:hypothetical protein
MSNIIKIAADLIDHTYREKLAERIEGEGTGSLSSDFPWDKIPTEDLELLYKTLTKKDPKLLWQLVTKLDPSDKR